MTAPSYVIQELATVLKGYATEVFGLMGNGNAHLIDALIANGLNYTAVRHETATVAAADAYTRVSGKIAIATTTYGAGYTNALTALAEAIKARTPMIVVVGDHPTGQVRDIDVDQEMLTAALGTRNYHLAQQGVTRTVQKAVRYALKVRKPVVISVPYDLVRGLAEPELASTPAAGLRLDDPNLLAELSQAVLGLPAEPLPITTPVPAAGQDQVDQALTVLRTAKKPLILAGRGAHLAQAGSQLAKIAEALGAATVSTALARGIFADTSADLGVAGGFGAEGAMQLVKEADVVLVVGASLNQFTMRFGDLLNSDATIVRIDIEAVSAPQSNSMLKQVLVQGDAAEVLELLLLGLREAKHEASGWRAQIQQRITASGVLDYETGTASGVCADGRLDPRSVAARIAELLPENTYITQDGGHFIGWANMYWPVASPAHMTMVGTAYMTIGLGFAATVGVAKAVPGATVALSTGDGGGLMALADLETAVREAQSLVIVIWNDAAYGAEVHLYGAMGLNERPMRIPEVNYAAVAEAFGATGVRVTKLEDLDALAAWRDSGSHGTILLDCRVSASVIAPYQREIQAVNGLPT